MTRAAHKASIMSSSTVHSALKNAMAELTTVSRMIDLEPLNETSVDLERQSSSNTTLSLQLPTSSYQSLSGPGLLHATRPDLPVMATPLPQLLSGGTVEQPQSLTQHRLCIQNLIHSRDSDSDLPASTMLPALPPVSISSSVMQATCNSEPTTSAPVLMKLVLHGGLIFTFNLDDVPAPMALRLADMNTLIQWWDDSSSEWNPITMPYKIKGKAVALKYWREIYKRDHRWDSAKNQWHLWKVRQLWDLYGMLTGVPVYHGTISERSRN